MIDLEDIKELESRTKVQDDSIAEDKDSSAVTENISIDNTENLTEIENANLLMSSPEFALDTFPEDEDRLDVVIFCLIS